MREDQLAWPTLVELAMIEAPPMASGARHLGGASCRSERQRGRATHLIYKEASSGSRRYGHLEDAVSLVTEELVGRFDLFQLEAVSHHC